MVKYDRKTLVEVLHKHDYNPTVMTPEWCSFALLLIIAENTTKKKDKK